MVSVLLETAKVILNSLTCAVHFSKNVNGGFHIKGS